MTNWQSHVLPHGKIEQLAPRLWIVTGTLPQGHMPRNMVLYELDSGGLLIHSAIALNEEGMQQMLEIGEPEIMIVPNRLHRLDAAVYLERFPKLKVIAPQAARAAVETQVKVHASCEELLPQAGVEYRVISGLKPFELCYEFAVENGKALVCTDALFNMEHQSGFDGFLFKYLGSSGFFGITRVGRIFIMNDKRALKSWLTTQAQRRDIRAICVGHGAPIVKNCDQALASAAARL